MQKEKILLVEDDAIIALSQKDIIESFGYTVDVVHSGRKAIEKSLSDLDIVLVLMDIDLSDDINGVKAAEKILKNRNLPIVFLTSHTEKEYTQQAKEIAGYGYVIKNANEFVLQSSIEMALKLFQAHEETRKREQAIKLNEQKLKQKNEQMRFLTEFSLSIASKKYNKDVFDFLAGQLKKITGAPLVTLQTYDPVKKIMITQKILADQKIVNTMMKISNGKLNQIESPISDEIYQEMTGQIIGFRKTLTECTFGEIPPSLDKIYRSITGVNRFYGIAYLIDNDLYGASLIGMHKDQPGPSIKLLESYAHIAAVALKNHVTEKKLIVSEKKYRNLINNTKDAIFTTDKNGNITFISESVQSMTGYKPREVTGKHFSAFILPQDVDSAIKQFNSKLKGTSNSFEFRILNKKGQEIWVRSSSKPVHLEESGVSGLIGILTDISAKKAADQKIDNLLTEKELILKEVHHRIKNNLNIVASIMSLEAKRFKDQKVQKAFMNTSRRVQSMMVLYDKLYRSENFREMSLNRYLTPLINEMIAVYPKSNEVTLQIKIDEIVLPAKILANIGIIINELLSNSMKHAFNSVECGQLSIIAKQKDNLLTLCIQDNGPGFPENFDMENPENFGLQLVKILIQQMRGSYKISTQKGTEFCFEIKI